MPGKQLHSIPALEKEIADLEYRLHNARYRLAEATGTPTESVSPSVDDDSSYLSLPEGAQSLPTSHPFPANTPQIPHQ